MVITRVGPFSAAKIFAVIHALIGVVVGAAFSVAGLVRAMAGPNDGGPLAGMLFGMGAIIILPIAYACMGFVGTLFMAWVYNLVASAIGGIEMDVR